MTRSYSLDSPHYGSFITGPESFENSIKVPKIYLFGNSHKDYKFFNLVIYRALSASICLLIDGEYIFRSLLCGFSKYNNNNKLF